MGTNALEQSIIVFSQNYLPLSRVNIRRAIVLLLTGKAEPMGLVKGCSWQIHSPSLVLEVPEYIRLTTRGTERLWKVPSVNRREVFKRDHHACQYCGCSNQLTIDHVLPLSKGGRHTWDNVVAACETCNQRKGNRTPEQANMPLRSKPKAPMHPMVAFAEQFWHGQAEEAEDVS